MIGRLKDFIFGKEPEPANELSLNGTEKQLFERALQLYVFVHHVRHDEVDEALAGQLKYSGNVVYSLVRNWLIDGKPSLEYMEFLNEQINKLRKLGPAQRQGLGIQPEDIAMLELAKEVKLTFRDDETKEVLRITYLPETGLCQWGMVG